MDYTTKKGRDEVRALRTAEVRAIDCGTWPRDSADWFRWNVLRVCCPFSSAAVNVAYSAQYAREMCVRDIEYCDGVEVRLKQGDESLRGWPGWERPR